MAPVARSTTPTPKSPTKDAKKQAKKAEEKAEEKAKKAGKAAAAGARDIPAEVSGNEYVPLIVPCIVLAVGAPSADFIDLNIFISVLGPLFVLTNFFVVAVLFYIYQKVKELPKEEKLRCPAVMAKGVKISEERIVTPHDYETGLCEARLKEVILSFVLVVGMYFYKGNVNFLAAQTIYTATKTWEPLFKCYVLGIEDRSFLTKPAQD